jgi:hypothetical protein
MGHLVQKREFVREFRVYDRVRLVAASGNIKIVDPDSAVCDLDRGGDMPRIAHLAKGFSINIAQRQARDNGDAVVTLLSIDRDMLVAELTHIGCREFSVPAFRFLKAKNVGLVVAQESANLGDPQPNGIDVPGRNFQIHVITPRRRNGRAAG